MVDINNDGLPELLVRPESRISVVWDVYTYSEDGAYLIKWDYDGLLIYDGMYIVPSYGTFVRHFSVYCTLNYKG